ncbi:bone morphogenetic protein receptor type-1B-like isoform X2 [Amphibalanus amphitrite]|uniref:bone morphogenetic protein receptor type-1B-like isoform X1 n=3 Tax=Amphibalanus amphitrite TaxID=1232801 RepID=UPI001C900082|nr:bone morphogenetic protein receptor type-1B-like isoform X1 [Amphibalanus amphitrite]XP_043206540.1 bone morphogenetic protein receptor type-1B-like isoform X2 [Amphibalanus amphitrite]
MKRMLCYCAGACPDGAVNNTCVTLPNSWCFAAVRETIDERTGGRVPERTYGCLPPGETGYMQCKSANSPFAVPTTIECCRDRDHCNRDLKPMYVIRTDDEDLTSEYVGYNAAVHQMALLVSVTLCLAVFIGIVAWMYLRYRKRLEQRDSAVPSPDYESLMPPGLGMTAGLAETSSGSGSGKPFLAQRTIAREIAVGEIVGQGRYGLVKRGAFQGQPVAVKVFFSLEEASWQREKDVYETCRLQHPNVLGFIAADITSGGGMRGCTEMWLITEYHSHGSLYDYLGSHVLQPLDALRMSLSIVQGLDYLHKEVIAAAIRPALAHRDIKSKNVLVKSDGECCIADFGLAVMYFNCGEKRDLDVASTRQGTRRYMAPEALDQTLNVNSFEAFKQADMYSLALVMWEITRRSATGDKMRDYEPYAVPYAGMVPADPSFDDMHQLVCEKQVRPPIAERWSKSQALTKLARIMRDCWRQKPGARLRALTVKKHLITALKNELHAVTTAGVHL